MGAQSSKVSGTSAVTVVQGGRTVGQGEKHATIYRSDGKPVSRERFLSGEIANASPVT